MPMSVPGMTAVLDTAILAVIPPLGPPIANPAQFATALATAIATALVPYLTSNVVVAGTATGAMGGGPGVPVVGTIS